jgi:geranylgeranyl diphosphate synthase type II
VGDVMIGLALRVLKADTADATVRILDSFTRGLVDVCEGQTLDREYETRRDITLDDYMTMISMKTGRLVEMAAEIGGIIGGGTPEAITALQAYARNVGQAFQIQDDLLDITADEKQLGKRIGGDIIEGKRTYLLVQAMENVKSGDDRVLIDTLLNNQGLSPDKIEAMRDLYQRNGILDSAQAAVEHYIALADQSLTALPDTPARSMLYWLTQMLLNRVS